MLKLRRIRLLAVTVAGLLAVSGAAFAAEHDTEPDGDTVFNLGYDAANRVLIVNSTASDSPYDCTAENGVLVIGYGAEDTGRVPVDTVQVEVEPGVFEALMFRNRPAEEVDDEFTPADEPVSYSGADADCALTGARVGGSNGQVNHGQIMKAFHELMEGRGMGCLNRVVAQSDLGKGDQQLRTPDTDPEFTPSAAGTVEFSTFAATCEKGKRDDNPGRGSERADRPRGNSDRAPGKNK